MAMFIDASQAKYEKRMQIYNVLAGGAPLPVTILLKKFVHISLIVVYLPCFCKKAVFWPVRLGVRTQDFHSCNTGSIPVRATRATQ